jgi:hypothetical protein
MSSPTFFLVNGNLTFDPIKPYLCTDEPHICYGPKVPVPPAPGGGGFGGATWGGGSYLPEKGLRRKYINVGGGADSAFIKKAVATVLKPGIKSPPAGPLEVPSGISKEEIQREMIRGLKKRVTELEAHIRSLKGTQVSERAALEAELEVVQAIAAQLLGRLEAVERQLLGAINPIVLTLPAPVIRAQTSGWRLLAGAGAAWIVARHLLPPKPPWIRATGYRVSAALALAGAYRVIDDL